MKASTFGAPVGLMRHGSMRSPVNELSREKKADILRDAVESQSMRGLAKTKRGNNGHEGGQGRVSRTTVQSLWADAGDVAIAFLDSRMRDLPSKVIEADEAHTYVKIRGRTLLLRKERPKPGTGVFWVWVAIDAQSKLLIPPQVGKRGLRDAKLFMADLKIRLKNRFQLTTDSHTPYLDAVEAAFGSEIDYVIVKKWKKRRKKVPKKDFKPSPAPPPKVRCGNPDLSLATTNHIENYFGNMRTDMARFTRKGRMNSKTLLNLKRALAIYTFCRNFIAIHQSLGTTPCVEAGIEDSVWTWEDFIDLVDEARARRRRERVQACLDSNNSLPEAIANNVQNEEAREQLAFVLLHSPTRRYAKLCRFDCSPARVGRDAGIRSFARRGCGQVACLSAWPESRRRDGATQLQQARCPPSAL